MTELQTETHWIRPYLERLNSAEGMSAENVMIEENNRRWEGKKIKQIKLKSVQRALNRFGFCKHGTGMEALEFGKGTSKNLKREINTIIRLRRHITQMRGGFHELERLMKEAELLPVERDFLYMVVEGYSLEMIEDMLMPNVDEGERKALREKFGLVV